MLLFWWLNTMGSFWMSPETELHEKTRLFPRAVMCAETPVSPDWRNRTCQPYSWPTDWRFSASWGPNWGSSWSPSDYCSTILWRVWGGSLIRGRLVCDFCDDEACNHSCELRFFRRHISPEYEKYKSYFFPLPWKLGWSAMTNSDRNFLY